MTLVVGLLMTLGVRGGELIDLQLFCDLDTPFSLVFLGSRLASSMAVAVSSRAGVSSGLWDCWNVLPSRGLRLGRRAAACSNIVTFEDL